MSILGDAVARYVVICHCVKADLFSYLDWVTSVLYGRCCTAIGDRLIGPHAGWLVQVKWPLVSDTSLNCCPNVDVVHPRVRCGQMWSAGQWLTEVDDTGRNGRGHLATLRHSLTQAYWRDSFGSLVSGSSYLLRVCCEHKVFAPRLPAINPESSNFWNWTMLRIIQSIFFRNRLL